jgi:hypothetical protein
MIMNTKRAKRIRDILKLIALPRDPPCTTSANSYTPVRVQRRWPLRGTGGHGYGWK